MPYTIASGIGHASVWVEYVNIELCATLPTYDPSRSLTNISSPLFLDRLQFVITTESNPRRVSTADNFFCLSYNK